MHNNFIKVGDNRVVLGYPPFKMEKHLVSVYTKKPRLGTDKRGKKSPYRRFW